VHAVVGTTLKGIAGVLQNNPLPGQAATIQSHGATPVAVSANQAITGGTTFLQLDVGGTFTAFTTGVVVAQAVESCPSSTSIQIITARLTNVATA
jgi:hypothetical protein